MINMNQVTICDAPSSSEVTTDREIATMRVRIADELRHELALAQAKQDRADAVFARSTAKRVHNRAIKCATAHKYAQITVALGFKRPSFESARVASAHLAASLDVADARAVLSADLDAE